MKDFDRRSLLCIELELSECVYNCLRTSKVYRVYSLDYGHIRALFECEEEQQSKQGAEKQPSSSSQPLKTRSDWPTRITYLPTSERRSFALLHHLCHCVRPRALSLSLPRLSVLRFYSFFTFLLLAIAVVYYLAWSCNRSCAIKKSKEKEKAPNVNHKKKSEGKRNSGDYI